MTKNIVFNIEPTPKGRPRLGRYGTYTPAKTKAAEEAIQWAWHGKPMEGPLKVSLRFYFKRPKKCLASFKPTRPDIDNLVKLVCDALNGLAWKDDGQIVILEAYKFYCNRLAPDPCIQLEISEVDG